MATIVNRRIVRKTVPTNIFSFEFLKKRGVPFVIRMICFAGLCWIGCVWCIPLVLLALWNRKKPSIISGSEQHAVHSIPTLSHNIVPPYWIPGILQVPFEFIPHSKGVSPSKIHDISYQSRRATLLWFNETQGNEEPLCVVVIGYEEATYKIETIVHDFSKKFPNCVIILPEGLTWCSKHFRVVPCETECFPFLGDTSVLKECLTQLSGEADQLFLVSVWPGSCVIPKLISELYSTVPELKIIGCVCTSVPISPSSYFKSIGIVSAIPLISSWKSVLRKNHDRFARQDLAALSAALCSWSAEDVAVSSIPFTDNMSTDPKSVYFSGWNYSQCAPACAQVPVLFVSSVSEISSKNEREAWKRIVEGNPHLALAVLPWGGKGFFRRGLISGSPILGEVSRSFLCSLPSTTESPTYHRESLKANRSLRQELETVSSDSGDDNHLRTNSSEFSHLIPSDKSDGSEISQDNSPVSDKEEALPLAREDANIASATARSPVAHSASPSKVSPTVRMSSPVVSEDRKPAVMIHEEPPQIPDFDSDLCGQETMSGDAGGATVGDNAPCAAASESTPTVPTGNVNQIQEVTSIAQAIPSHSLNTRPALGNRGKKRKNKKGL